MQYTVTAPFRDIDGITKQIGWLVELTVDRAIKLHRQGFIAGPIYRPPVPEPWQAKMDLLETMVVAGNGNKTTSREENIAGLASAVALANALKVTLNAHYADALDHTTAPDTANTVVSETANDIPTLITLVTELLTSYDTHDADAELVANWVYHKAQEAGDHSLASAVAPTTLQECITRLNDIKAKYNAHDADNTTHGVGSAHQEATADAAYGAAIRVAATGALTGDLVTWGILDSGTGTVIGVSAAAGKDIVDFTFDADPQNDAIITYLITRKVNV